MQNTEACLFVPVDTALKWYFICKNLYQSVKNLTLDQTLNLTLDQSIFKKHTASVRDITEIITEPNFKCSLKNFGLPS